jgi:hypothetical protein
MLTDIVVIDDVFDDPDFIVHKARGMQYYDRFNHPDTINDVSQTNYSGVRTEQLYELDNALYNHCNRTILDKVIKSCFNYGNSIVDYQYNNRLFFHYLPIDNIFNESWLHRDASLCAGIVYLKKNPPPNTGTILIKDSKEIVVENRYNRLVLYNAGILHSPQSSFGNTVYDSRLTLTIFFSQLAFNMRYNNAY